MAFEAYLRQATMPQRRGRRVTYTVSIGVHVAALVGAVAYSFWHVEELTPPTVIVTFVTAAAAPPPPPPPPPLGGGTAAPKHKTTVVRPKLEVVPKTTEVVQPKVEPVKEPPKETPREVVKEEAKSTKPDNPAGPGSGDGVKDGITGGVKGGTVGGVIGGTGKAQNLEVTSVKSLPPLMGAQQKISGADPDMPARLRRAGANYLVMAKICVAPSGAVESVTVLKHAEPTLDSNVVTTVKTWRFRPLRANGTAVPFCYFGRFEFKSE